ncbi:hypothetical protein D3C76_1877750 [compost metagenome]
MKSNAPASSAIMVSFMPCSLIPESIITGTKDSFIIDFNASNPFISGISTSIVIISGFNSSDF